jgi:hypothetical protein
VAGDTRRLPRVIGCVNVLGGRQRRIQTDTLVVALAIGAWPNEP